MDTPAQQTQAEEFRQKYLYALAEVENTRKREQRLSIDAMHEFKRHLLLKFLPVLDNLERAVAHQEAEGLREGLSATLRGFESALESEGITPVLTIGEHFDPKVAEAVGAQQREDVGDDVVVAETQRGYLLDDRVLRPAKVIVARTG